LISRFSYHYFSNHRSDFESYKTADDFVQNYEVPEKVYLKFLSYSGLDTLTANPEEGSILTAENLESVKPEIKKYLKAYFGKQLFYYDGFFPVYYRGDPFIEAALRTLDQKS
jgi:carboxyl-terminal processing protease